MGQPSDPSIDKELVYQPARRVHQHMVEPSCKHEPFILIYLLGNIPYIWELGFVVVYAADPVYHGP